MFGVFPENPSEKFSNESFSIASETTIQKNSRNYQKNSKEIFSIANKTTTSCYLNFVRKFPRSIFKITPSEFSAKSIALVSRRIYGELFGIP